MFNFGKKDVPVTIRFHFASQADNRKRLTWDDLETMEGLQNGGASLHGLKNLAARFMADEANQYLPHDKALKVLGALNVDDINGVLQQFTEALRDAAVPPTNAPASNSHSEAGAEKARPAG